MSARMIWKGLHPCGVPSLEFLPDALLAGEDSQFQQKMVGCITGLVPQKGIHLIRQAIYRTIELGGQFFLLGCSPVHHIQICCWDEISRISKRPNLVGYEPRSSPKRRSLGQQFELRGAVLPLPLWDPFPPILLA